MNELVLKISKVADEMKNLAQRAVKLYSVEVVSIIREREHDNNRIQLYLDYMLDFCFDDGMLQTKSSAANIMISIPKQ